MLEPIWVSGTKPEASKLATPLAVPFSELAIAPTCAAVVPCGLLVLLVCVVKSALEADPRAVKVPLAVVDPVPPLEIERLPERLFKDRLASFTSKSISELGASKVTLILLDADLVFMHYI